MMRGGEDFSGVGPGGECVCFFTILSSTALSLERVPPIE